VADDYLCPESKSADSLSVRFCRRNDNVSNLSNQSQCGKKSFRNFFLLPEISGSYILFLGMQRLSYLAKLSKECRARLDLRDRFRRSGDKVGKCPMRIVMPSKCSSTATCL
jgi:hypothetical protein